MPRRRRPGRVRTVATRVVALVALVAAGWLGVRGLRLAGFEFRWERASRATGAGAPAAPDPAVPTGAASEPADGVGADGAGSRAGAASGGPALEPPRVRGGPAGSGAPATIGFDRLADGTSACAPPCPVATEWEERGLIVSFRSWSADSTRPLVLDGREYLPDGRPTLALGPAFRPGRGLEVGVIRLDFPGRPRSVSFSLFGPDLVRRFDVAAWSGTSPLPSRAVRHAVRGRYDAGGTGTFREERVTVTAEGGIDRISLDGWGPPGHLLLVDDLEIVP